MPVRLRRDPPGTQFRATCRGGRAALFTAAALRCNQYRQRASYFDRGLPLGRFAMTVTGGAAGVGRSPSWPRWAWTNVAWAVRKLVRAPRTAMKPRWPSYARIGACAVTSLIVIVGLMIFVDAWAVETVLHLPRWVVAPFKEVTDFGKSGWFLFPIGLGLALVAALAHYPSDVFTAAIVGAVGAWLVRDYFAARRLGFAIDADGRVRALPGPSFARIKRVARRLLAP